MDDPKAAVAASSPAIETVVSTTVAELQWHQLFRGRMIGSGHFGGVRAVWYDGELMALKLLPIQEKPYNTEAVSYTHLTLPTILLV